MSIKLPATKHTRNFVTRWLLIASALVIGVIVWQRSSVTSPWRGSINNFGSLVSSGNRLALATSDPTSLDSLDLWAQASPADTSDPGTGEISADKSSELVKRANEKQVQLSKLLATKKNQQLKDFEGKAIEAKESDNLIFNIKDATNSGSRSRAVSALNQKDAGQRPKITYEIITVDPAAEYLATNSAYQKFANRENYYTNLDFENSSDVELKITLSNKNQVEVGANFSPYFARLASTGNILDFSESSTKRANLTQLVNTFNKSLPLKSTTKDAKSVKKIFQNPDINLLANASKFELPFFNEFIQNSVHSMDTILPVYSGFNYVSKSYDTETCFDFIVSVEDKTGEVIELNLSDIPVIGSLFSNFPSVVINPDTTTLYSTKTRLCAKDAYAAIKMDIAKEVFNNLSISESYNPQNRFDEVFSQAFLSNLQQNGLSGVFSRAGGALTNNKDYIKNSLLELHNIFTCQDLSANGDLVKVLNEKSTEGEYAELIDLITNKTDCLDISGKFVESPTVVRWCQKGWLPSSYCSRFSNASKLEEICLVPETILTTTSGTSSSSNDSNQNQNTEAEGSQDSLATAAFASPVPSKTTVDFGVSTGPNGSIPHPGIDVTAPIGTPVAAIADGKCIFAKEVDAFGQSNYLIWATNKNPNDPRNEGLQAFGRAILIEHTLQNGQKIYALYAHLSNIDSRIYGCKESDNIRVSRGQTIGKIGEAGRAWGSHLHFEVRKKKTASSFSNRTYYYSGPTGTTQGCGADYCNPRCLVESPNNCSFGSPPTTNPVGPGTDPVTGPTPPTTGEQCADIDPIEGIGAEGNVPGQYTVESLKAYVDERCGGMTQYVNQNSVNLVNLVQSTGLLAETNQIAAGTKNARQLFGDRYSADIFGLIKRVSDITGVPAAKLAAQLAVESYGANVTDINRLTSGGRFNGNVDQIVLSVTRPNYCGCVGVSQFCPSGASSYLFPSSTHYADVRQCITQLGFSQPENSTINIAYVGSSMCAMAIKLQYDTGGKNLAGWEDGCCTGGQYTPDSCRYTAASRSYLGSCTNNEASVKYCEQTSNICRSDSLISQAKRILN